MSIWKRRKLPSQPMTDAQGAKGHGEEPQDLKTISNGTIGPTRILGQDDIHPELAQSLHTAVISSQPDAKIHASSLEDINILLHSYGFQCQRLLGSGGMGSVFLAMDTKLQRMVAIKVLLPKFSQNQQFRELFLKEAEIVAKFTHPNIVQIYSIHLIKNIYFIVMEYVEGITLRDKIRREGRITEDITLRIIDQVSLALAETHKRGIIHRDIKPQNILLTREGIPKVADFGLAVNIRETSMEGTTTAGTPTYMSPEQARGDLPIPASDIYSLGVVMYFMLSGKIPYRSTSVMKVMREISAGNKIDITEVAPGLSSSLVKVVRKAMETQISHRYLNMEAFNAAVRDAWLSYQKRGLKPMIPRVKRAAWTYFAPPIALVIGILTGYLVHNPRMKQASVTYEQAFSPRVEHIKRSLRSIMDNETNKAVQLECATMITVLDQALKRKDPHELSQQISHAEFIVDWSELQAILLKLKESGALQGELLTEAQALWDSAQKKDKENFYKHRTLLFRALKKTSTNY
ncbi:serine/threonine protein kinase [Candidatus Sumerlaeota bacterium]|nr:serine/threonine protein kinase [Candidatus Sumerlaeota bacterium]